MGNNDIRWKQRLDNYIRSVDRLGKIINVYNRLESTIGSSDYDEDLFDSAKIALIKSFELAFELSWNVMKDYLKYQGFENIMGSRDAIRRSLEEGLIEDRRWMESISDRNLASHDYDEQIAQEIQHNIINCYYPLFLSFRQKMTNIAQQG